MRTLGSFGAGNKPLWKKNGTGPYWPQILLHLTLPLSQFVSCLNALSVPPGAIARAAGCLHSVGDQRALPLQLENKATRCMHTWHIVTYSASYHFLRSIFGIILALLFGL